MIFMLASITLITLTNGQDCPEGCEGCTCDVKGSSFTVTCEDYNKTVLPTCMNESTSALYIYNSGINAINDGDFENATMLTAIEITNSRLDSINAEAFPNMTLLKRVSFRGNQIEQINDGVFARTPNLTSLDLTNNKPENIVMCRVVPFFSKFINL